MYKASQIQTRLETIKIKCQLNDKNNFLNNFLKPVPVKKTKKLNNIERKF